MRKRLLFISLIIACFATVGVGQTALQGTVTDIENDEPIVFGNVALYKNGNLVTGTETDIEGNYSFPNIDPGTYDVEFSYVGYQSKRIEDVVVKAGQANRLDVDMSSGVMMEEIEVVDYKVPLIEQDNTTQGGVLTSDQIKNLPTKNINALAATTAGLSSVNEGDISIRGSRTNATDYYIDGVRVSSSNLIPQTEIEQMQVLTGGIPALYGDVVGGVISITTKGPSSEFSGGVEVETSENLDAYGYNLVNMNLSGPIVKDSASGQSILGFRLSGQYKSQDEDNPPYTGVYRAPSSVINELEQDPVDFIGNTPILNAEKLQDRAHGGEVRLMDARPNEGRQDIDLTGKLDARINDNVDMTFTGSFTDIQDRFSPNAPGGFNNNWAVLNWKNNPQRDVLRYRGNFRFRHRLGTTMTKGSDLTQEQKEKRKNALIQNVSYNLQVGYEHTESSRSDYRHGDNLFDYGYVGNFDIFWDESITSTRDRLPGSPFNVDPVTGDTSWFGHVGYQETLNDGGYTGNYNINPVYARYNEEAIENNGGQYGSLLEFPFFNGFQSSIGTDVWSNVLTNVGAVYNFNQKSEDERYTFNFTGSFEIVPGESQRGRHSIEFGATYEERVNRDWRIAPSGLWENARQLANAHLQGVDTNEVVRYTQATNPATGITYDSIPLYAANVDEEPSGLFIHEVRDLVGKDINEYVNVNELTPDQLSLDMFSATELTNQELLSYEGYDYLGNKLESNVTFEDFFNGVGPQGNRTYNVSAFRPNYFAAYVQDKFTYEDIIFRLGVRVDRYDANTKVLKDPYSLYDIQTADEFFGNNPSLERPGGVEDDYKVYLSGPESDEAPIGYRVGDQWYNANGTAVNRGAIVFDGALAHPAYTPREADIKDLGFNVDAAFEDYEPQVNWMPRLAFSFPISDEANFFAHYDILVQRPSSNVYVSPLEYYYWEDAGRTPNDNPNLKPVKTIDYEVGFQQKLSNSSALKVSAYYKEMRDLIQQRALLHVAEPVGQYTTYQNIDFGTVKGFSFQYDLRRTGNVQMKANYTLQFADGTGSDANSQQAIVNSGLSVRQVRQLFPLDYDERHRFNFTFDFRYGSGKKYNGPELFGKDIFANAGLNLQATIASGRPFTKRKQAQAFGAGGFENTINGSRLPWNYTLDLRIDKNFRLTDPATDGSKPLYLNVYLRVQNLLNTENVIGVYTASGSPSNDGYLSTSQGQQNLEQIQQQAQQGAPGVDRYLQAYQWRLIDPSNYAFPRRIYLGAVFEF